jgi:phosphate transport system substrate-binding protein
MEPRGKSLQNQETSALKITLPGDTGKKQVQGTRLKAQGSKLLGSILMNIKTTIVDEKIIKKIGWGTLLLVLFSLLGCQKPQGGLTVVGSTSVEPFAEMLAEEYMSHHGERKVYVQGGGSSAGIQAIQTGAADVGMSSRQLMPGEGNLTAVPIAYDAIAVIVHPSNRTNNLNLDQIRGIFSGQITNWHAVGGFDRPITLVTREEGSGTREAFQHLLMGKTEISLGALVQDSNGAIRQVVADDPNALGYISLGLVNDRVKAIEIDGVVPNIENIKKLRYKVIRPFLFVFNAEPKGLAKDFLDYILSPEGQKLLIQEGLIGSTTISEFQKQGKSGSK